MLGSPPATTAAEAPSGEGSSGPGSDSCVTRPWGSTAEAKLRRGVEVAAASKLDCDPDTGYVGFEQQHRVRPSELVFHVCDHVFIGSEYGAADFPLLAALGISCIINCTAGSRAVPNFGELPATELPAAAARWCTAFDDAEVNPGPAKGTPSDTAGTDGDEAKAVEGAAGGESTAPAPAERDRSVGGIAAGLTVEAVGAAREAVGGRFDYVNFAIRDNVGQDCRPAMQEGYEAIEAWGREGRRVLVHCSAGLSRSATVVLAWLMRAKRHSLATAVATLTKARGRQLMVNPSFWSRLAQLERTLAGKAPNAPTPPSFDFEPWVVEDLGDGGGGFGFPTAKVREGLRRLNWDVDAVYEELLAAADAAPAGDDGARCVAGCGFFGTPANDGMCHKCYQASKLRSAGDS